MPDSTAPPPAAPAMPAPTNLPAPPVAPGGDRNQLPLRLGIGIVLLTALVLWGTRWALLQEVEATTEDAYVDGNVVSVTPQVSGVVVAIHADNTDYVAAGSVLLAIDSTDARLAVARAEAQLARTVRMVRGQFAAAAQTRANVEMRKVELARAMADLERRRRMGESGAISGEEIEHAQETVKAANAGLVLASQQLAGSTALIDRTSIASHPDVRIAAAQLRDAYVAAYRCAVPAPVAGMITKRSVQVGQRIAPGMSLMSVVPMDQLWINANFKESQLRHIRLGQAVNVTADVYGSEVVYHGVVSGQEAGTGSAFSLLPAQNATGNWIKVVQRVPVRIALDPKELAAHPLQLGLSTRVTIDTTRHDGSRLVNPGTPPRGYATKVFGNELASADSLVERIIQSNL